MRNTISNQINYGRGLLYLLRHIECLIKLVGVDYVGIGSDFDGFVVFPQKLDDVSTYPLITKALVEKGYAQKGLSKILGGNVLKVLKANEVKLNIEGHT